MSVTAIPLQGIAEIRPGDDLAAMIVETLALPGDQLTLLGTDVLVIAHKAVSKAEGALRSLSDVEVGERARALALAHGKDPRHVQVVLDEARAVLRAGHGVIICETHHGFICANAGVDASNVPGDDVVVAASRRSRSLRARVCARACAR